MSPPTANAFTQSKKTGEPGDERFAMFEYSSFETDKFITAFLKKFMSIFCQSFAFYTYFGLTKLAGKDKINVTKATPRIEVCELP